MLKYILPVLALTLGSVAYAHCGTCGGEGAHKKDDKAACCIKDAEKSKDSCCAKDGDKKSECCKSEKKCDDAGKCELKNGETKSEEKKAEAAK